MDHADRELLADAITGRIMERLEPKFAALADLPGRVKAIEEQHRSQDKLRRGLILTVVAGIIPAVLTWGGLVVMYVRGH